jgi:3-phosphoshikimate 1-carboxyvinyltransferase
MTRTITPSFISGTVTAPASKSAMQRACAAALIKGGKTVLKNPGISNDDRAALSIIQALGATVTEEDGEMIIESNGVRPRNSQIHCGESGLSVRMFTPIAALSNQTIVVEGEGSLLKRPLHFFTEVLPQLDVSVESNKSLLPLTIAGPLQPKNLRVDGSLSSQFITGLLMAYAAAGAHDVTIHVEGLNSKPYVDLTLNVMQAFGLPVPEHDHYQKFHFKASNVSAVAPEVSYRVEGDWSGAAFLLVAGAVAGKGGVTVTGLDVYSQQADKAVLQALMSAQAVMSIHAEYVEVRKSGLVPFHFNAVDCPDLFPPLVVLAAFAEGTSVIEGVHRLTHKESNRALTLQEEFGKLGIPIRFQDDLMIIEGGHPVKATTVHSHHDHRIAMACAIAALCAEGPVSIEGADAVNKSYPQFWQHLSQLQQQA